MPRDKRRVGRQLLNPKLEPHPAPGHRVTLPHPVRWSTLQPMAVALAAALPPGALHTFTRALMGVTAPLRWLDELHGLAECALNGDPMAGARFRSRVEAHGRAGGITHSPAPRPGCECGPCEQVEESVQPDDGTAPLDEHGVAALLVATAKLYCHGDNRRDAALSTLLAVAIEATVVNDLVHAVRAEGAEAAGVLLADWVARQQALSLDAASVMRTMSAPGMPDFGVPAPPKDLVPPLGGGVAEILAKLRGHKHLDPDIWDPPLIVHRDYRYVDYRNFPFFRCVRLVHEKIRARAEVKPPERPLSPTWSVGITSLKGGPCGGALVRIVGTGLKTPGAVLLVPFADGCHTVVPTTWTDTLIEFTLPAGAISGPVGFGNGPYIAAYDAWAAEQNRLADEIEVLPCLPPDLPFVPPFRECPPDIGVNHLVAGTAIIDAFTANGQTQLVVETGQAATLAWAVRNAVHVRLTRLSTEGPLLAGATSLNDPASSTFALGILSSGKPIECRYQLTAIGPCGAVTRDVVIDVSKRPNLYVESVEVTQGIQTIPPTVELVAGKPTVVRVTVRHGIGSFGGGIVSNVTGRIRVRKQGGGTSAWFDAANGTSPMSAMPGAKIDVGMFPLRQLTDDTLNFLLPPGECHLPCRYEIEVRVAWFGAIGAFAGFDQSVPYMTPATYKFTPRRVLDVRYGLLIWNGLPVPSIAACEAAISGAAPYLPTPTINMSLLGMPAASWTQGSDSNATALAKCADDLYEQRNCDDIGDWFANLFGDCPMDDDVIWAYFHTANIGGDAAAIPSNTLVSDPNSSVLAHELGHCLDQKHVNDGCGAKGGDDMKDWNGGAIGDVCFDSWNNAAIGTPRELMGYCLPRWTSAKRWVRLWDFIGP